MPNRVTCDNCNKKFGSKQIYDHYDTCMYETYKHLPGTLISLKSHGITGALYVMYIITGIEITFEQLDDFINDEWFEECSMCEHLSDFDGVDMDDLIYECDDGVSILYTYDFGKSTYVDITILNKLEGKTKKNDIGCIFMNDAPFIKCKQCKAAQAIVYYCQQPYCGFCKESVSNEEMCCDIVNSPRCGICGW